MKQQMVEISQLVLQTTLTPTEGRTPLKKQ